MTILSYIILLFFACTYIIFPSPCPETFSYIIQECISIEAPIVCFNIGAPAERLRKYNYKYCEIVDNFTSEALLEAVINLYNRVKYDKLNN